MERLLFLVAISLLIGWAIGFFAMNSGGLIHILLIIAVIALIIRIFQVK